MATTSRRFIVGFSVLARELGMALQAKRNENGCGVNTRMANPIRVSGQIWQGGAPDYLTSHGVLRAESLGAEVISLTATSLGRDESDC